MKDAKDLILSFLLPYYDYYYHIIASDHFSEDIWSTVGLFLGRYQKFDIKMF